MAGFIVHDLASYTIGVKDPIIETEKNTEDKMRKLREQFAAHGMLHSVDMVMLVGNRGHPHVLTMQMGSSFFKLPGGEVLPGEKALDGVHRILNKLFGTEGVAGQWQPTDLLSEWFRPNFDANIYPYVPAHCSKPKEKRQVYLVSLPDACSFQVPKNYKLVAVPMFEIFDNKECYGIVISSLPQLLSRLRLICAPSPGDEPSVATPARPATTRGDTGEPETPVDLSAPTPTTVID